MDSRINIKGHLYSLNQPKVMGILNLTPDSFYAGSRVQNEKDALTRVEQMIEDGMDILDIGAVSSRPGATLPDLDEERIRLEKPLKEIVAHFPDLIISIDTFRSEIARMAADLGAAIINDISAGELDGKMMDTVGKLHLPYILMHMQNIPENMQFNPNYQNIIQELVVYFAERVQAAYDNGIHDIILDPGFGFGKTVEHNYQILQNLREFTTLNCPLLVGVSRKSMLWKPLNIQPEQALNASTIVHTMALERGADILRVHDVRAAKECIEVYNIFKKSNNI